VQLTAAGCVINANRWGKLRTPTPDAGLLAVAAGAAVAVAVAVAVAAAAAAAASAASVIDMASHKQKYARGGNVCGPATKQSPVYLCHFRQRNHPSVGYMIAPSSCCCCCC